MALRGLAACSKKLSRSACEHSLNSMCATAASRGRYAQTFQTFSSVVKHLINQLINHSEIVEDIKGEAARIEEQHGDSLQYLIDKLSRSNIDTAYIENLCRLLQISNNEILISEYSLSDVEKLLAKQIELHPNNLDGYLEYAHFKFSVLDQNQEARSIILEAINLAEEKIKDLKQLLTQIDNDDSLSKT